MPYAGWKRDWGGSDAALGVLYEAVACCCEYLESADLGGSVALGAEVDLFYGVRVVESEVFDSHLGQLEGDLATNGAYSDDGDVVGESLFEAA